jgi:hypothetical protein
MYNNQLLKIVRDVVIFVLKQDNIDLDENNISNLMTTERKIKVNNILFKKFKSGELKIDMKLTDTGLKAYISALQSHMLRKESKKCFTLCDEVEFWQGYEEWLDSINEDVFPNSDIE